MIMTKTKINVAVKNYHCNGEQLCEDFEELRVKKKKKKEKTTKQPELCTSRFQGMLTNWYDR